MDKQYRWHKHREDLRVIAFVGRSAGVFSGGGGGGGGESSAWVKRIEASQKTRPKRVTVRLKDEWKEEDRTVFFLSFPFIPFQEVRCAQYSV